MKQKQFQALAVLFPLALAVMGGASACATTAPPAALETPNPAPPVATAALRPMVWKVEKAGLPASYLVASVHVLDSKTTLPPAFDDAWQATESLVLEVDVSDPETQEIARELAQRRMMLPPDQSLKTMLPSATFKALQREMSDVGINPMMVGHLQPWMAAMLLSDVKMHRAGYVSGFGVEGRLAKRAAEEKRQIVALESPAEQIDALASLDEALAAQALSELVNQSDGAFKSDLKTMMDAWRRGDDAALLDLVVKGSETPKAKAYLEVTIFKRNEILGKRAADLLEDGTKHLIAVGAAHTVGPRSVVKVLEAEGYTVTRASPQSAP